MLEGMTIDTSTTIAVLDFRRQTMALQWHALSGTWTACDSPPALVHGIALISATGPNICVYGQGGRLKLQIGPNQFAMAENSPRVSCTRGIASFGFRRRFVVRSGSGGILFSTSYWTHQGRDFYKWLAERSEDPDWRMACGHQWSEGLAAEALRPD
jgi:hypothetical protein